MNAETIRVRSRKVPSGTVQEIDKLLAHLSAIEAQRSGDDGLSVRSLGAAA